MEKEGSAIYLCPGCGAFVSENASKCPNCDTDLDAAPSEDMETEKDIAVQDEAELEITLLEKEVAAEDASPTVTLFMCSVCGAFTSSDASVCPNCGTAMEGEEEIGPSISPEEPEAEIFDMLVAEDDEKLVEDNDLDALQEIENQAGINLFLYGISDRKDQADDSPEETLPERSDESDDLLSHLVYEASRDEIDKAAEREEAMNSVEDLLAIEPARTPITDNDTIALCKNCGGFVSETATVCNICGTSLTPVTLMKSQSDTSAPDGRFSDEEAGDELRKMLGVKDDATLDPDAGKHFQSDGSLNLCTVCGAFISQEAEICPVCGTHIEDMPEFIPSMDVAGPEQEHHGLAICPHCGVFVQEGAKECLSCIKPIPEGATIPLVEVLEKPQDIDQAFNLLKTFLGVKKALELGPISEKPLATLDLCPDCGAFVSMNAVVCSVCGNPLFEGAEDVLDIERKLGEMGFIECPNCGSNIPPDSGSCQFCGMTFVTGEVAAQPEVPDNEIPELMDLELGTTIVPSQSEAPEDEIPGLLDLELDTTVEVSQPEVPDNEIPALPDLKLESTSKELEPAAAKTIHDEPAEDLADDIMYMLELGDEGSTELAVEQDIPEPLIAKPEPFVGEAEPADVGIAHEPAGNLEDDVMDMLVLGDEEPVEPESEVPEDNMLPEFIESEAEATADAVIEATELEFESPEFIAEDVPSSEPEIHGILPEEVPEPLGSIESEPVLFIEPEFAEPDTVEEYGEEPLVGEEVQPPSQPMEVPDIEASRHTSVHPANWTTGVYVSVATICFFLFFYLMVPGDYAPGLAVIFGTLLLIGIYLAVAERSIFFRGDLKQAGVFIIGFMLALTVLVHWPLGILNSVTGLAAQPALDRILISISVLITCIGLLWIRARVRFVFTWFFGNMLLFFCTVISFTHSNFGTGIDSPVLIVAGFGCALIFLSLIFLQYERAISTSIETDVVRGDAHYLRRDYVKALASYDDALTKAQVKKVEALGSVMVHYDVPWYSKGSALILMGNFEEGIKCLEMALAINPCNEVTWVNKGNAHSKLGQHDLAMECYAKAIECNPFYEIAWNNLGNVYARRKDYLGALRHYNRAIKINFRYDDAWINKGYVLAKMGKREQAIDCLNHVGSRAKGSPVKMDRDAHLL